MSAPAPLNERLARLERIAHHMDRAFRIPGTRIRFGWDSVLGLVPGVGDTAALLPACYILFEANRLGTPRWLIARMAVNTGFDWLAGLVPIVGDIVDVGVKSNARNVALLKAHHEKGSLERAAYGRLSDSDLSVR